MGEACNVDGAGLAATWGTKLEEKGVGFSLLKSTCEKLEKGRRRELLF